MKAKIIFILVSLLITSCSTKTSIKDDAHTSESWATTKRQEHLKNVHDSTTWDYEMLEIDKQMVGLGDFGPFGLGAFPVPDYDILGSESFKGVGNKSGEFHLGDKKLLMNSFFVAQNALNEKRLEGRKDEVFFQVIILTDTIDNENYELNQNVILSRNHPDYLGQGFVKTKDIRIDYSAFQTAENDAYAIVNTRLFNLNFGKTIVIAPQKDKTLRSLQIQSLQLTSASVTEFTKNLITREKVIDFFENESNI